MTPAEEIYADVLSLTAGVHVTLEDFTRPEFRKVSVSSTQDTTGAWVQVFTTDLGYVVQALPVDDLGVQMGTIR